MKHKLTKHHVVPRSRLDEFDEIKHNIVMWDDDFHSTWHKLFANMTPSEVIEFINLITKPHGKWTKRTLMQARIKIMRGGKDNG